VDLVGSDNVAEIDEKDCSPKGVPKKGTKGTKATDRSGTENKETQVWKRRLSSLQTPIICKNHMERARDGSQKWNQFGVGRERLWAFLRCHEGEGR